MKRVTYIDSLKALGMFLVYYGHLAEKLYEGGVEPAFLHFKLIYSVHMPLFFFLAGVFFKISDTSLVLSIKSKFKRRIIPVFTFAVLAIPGWIFLSDKQLLDIAIMSKRYLFGYPSLNITTWFLICLFTVEIIVKIMCQLLSLKNIKQIIGCIFILAILGWFVSDYKSQISYVTKIPVNFLFWNESIVASSFYLLGFSLKDFVLKKQPKFIDFFLLVVGGAMFITTFNFNNSFAKNMPEVVMMVRTSHGNYILFYFTATVGILSLIAFSRLLSVTSKPITFVGNNTLIYLGLNGISFTFIDHYIINNIPYEISSNLAVFLFCTIYILMIMLLFSPIVSLLNKKIPEFVANKYTDSSLIPSLSYCSFFIIKRCKYLKSIYLLR